jgi:hypothetical protein
MERDWTKANGGLAKKAVGATFTQVMLKLSIM